MCKRHKSLEKLRTTKEPSKFNAARKSSIELSKRNINRRRRITRKKISQTQSNNENHPATVREGDKSHTEEQERTPQIVLKGSLSRPLWIPPKVVLFPVSLTAAIVRSRLWASSARERDAGGKGE